MVQQTILGRQSDFNEELWVWDPDNKSPEVILSGNSHAAYFHIDPVTESTGTAGVRGNKGFTDGEHYWEITFLEPLFGSSVMIGIGTREALLHTNSYQYIDLVGADKNSWGLSYKGTIWHEGHSKDYCEPFYEQTTVIGVHLNLYDGTLSFYKNGRNLGVAFTDIGTVDGPLYPIISSTAALTEIEVGLRTCRYLSLQDKCCATIAKKLTSGHDVEKLPLPNMIREHLKALK